MSVALAIGMLLGQSGAEAIAPMQVVSPFGPRGANLPPEVELVSNPDYPSRALREERQGATVIELAISRWGTLADCRIVASSGHRDLDEASCYHFARRARFVPATDAEGRSTVGTLTRRLTWAIPSDRDARLRAGNSASIIFVSEGFPQSPRAKNLAWSVLSEGDYPIAALTARREGTSLISLHVEPDGTVADCSIRATSGSPDLDAKACELATERSAFLPALDIEGRPIAGRYDTGMEWRVDSLRSAPVVPSSMSRDESRPRLAYASPGESEMNLVLRKTGKIENCKVTGDPPPSSIPGVFGICDLVKRSPPMLMEPLRDENGAPHDRAVRVRLIIEVGAPAP